MGCLTMNYDKFFYFNRYLKTALGNLLLELYTSICIHRMNANTEMSVLVTQCSFLKSLYI